MRYEAAVGRDQGASGVLSCAPVADLLEPGDRPQEVTTLSRRERWLDGLTWAFVALGIALRLSRYGCNFPLWGDESFVAINFIARGYRALLDPLDYGQICPVLFLWIERFLAIHLGFQEWSLRLFPLICGVASVVLFRQVAGQVLGGLARLLAMAIFAVSFHPIRHAAEVKPYAGDLLVALVLLSLALRWRRMPDRTVWLWLLAAAAPLALGLSHPALFIVGGISLGLVVPVWSQRQRRVWAPFLVFHLAAGLTFLGLYALSTRLQEQLALKGLRSYWAASFPPLDSPLRLARWLIEVHTGTMLAYPGGGRGGASSATLAAVLVGAVWLWRRGRRGVVVMLLTPFVLALAAAALQRYPYGVEARQMQFVAPAICLLAGLGAARLLRAIPGERPRRGLASLGLGALAAIGLASVISDLKHPYRFPSDDRAREFARRFWPEEARTAELACLRSDFGVDPPRQKNLRTAIFICNQWIYSPQRRLHGGPRWDALSPRRPLRCVLYDETSPEDPAFQAWLARMRPSFELRRVERIEIAPAPARPGLGGEHLLVYDFVPRSDTPIVPPTVAGMGLQTGPMRR